MKYQMVEDQPTFPAMKPIALPAEYCVAPVSSKDDVNAVDLALTEQVGLCTDEAELTVLTERQEAFKKLQAEIIARFDAFEVKKAAKLASTLANRCIVFGCKQTHRAGSLFCGFHPGIHRQIARKVRKDLGKTPAMRLQITAA